jgi:Tetratricopeptide repeat
MGFDRQRVMEIFVRPVTGPGRVGSGYRVTASSVLTAGHLVASLPIRSATAADDMTGDCQLRPLGSQGWLRGWVLWRDDSADVALVGLPGDASALPSGSPMPRWGVVRGAEAVSCAAVGFPWAQEQPKGVRDSEQLIGFIAPLSTAKTGQLSLTAVTAAPKRREHMSPWAGMSGAALFAGPYLIGVVIVDPPRFGENRLVAAPVAALPADAQFAQLTGITTAAMQSVQPRFRLAVTQDLSVVVLPPYRPLPGDLTFAKAPVRLLLPEHGVVPFLRREQALAGFQDWCRGPARFSLRVLTGEAGTGKTRLAGELASRLITDGWEAGFSDADVPGGATRLEAERPTLLIVDDADLKVALVSDLVTTLANQPSGPPFRLLLVARHMQASYGAWWQQVSSNTAGLSEDFAAEAVTFEAGQLSPDEQLLHHRAACAAFTAQLERPASRALAALGDSSPRPANDFVSPLLVHMNALLTVLGDRAVGADTTAVSPVGSPRERVLQRILDRERRRWEPLVAEFGTTITMKIVTAACLLAPRSRPEVLSAINAIPSLREATALQRERIADWLHNAYPYPGGGVAPLRPDLITEQLLAESPDLTELVLSTAEVATSAEQQAHLLGELTRAAPNRSVIHDALATLLRTRLPTLVDLALDNVTSPLPSVLEAALRQAPQPRAALGLIDRLPRQSTALASLAATLGDQATVIWRGGVAVNPDDYLPLLADALISQSIRLRELGQREQALGRVDEALTIYRKLAKGKPKKFRPGLALTLHNRSIMLSSLGRHEEALAAAEEAVSIYLKLAEAKPNEFLANLAGALNTQSVSLANLGRREEALAAITQAVTTYEKLAKAQPGQFRRSLAGSLINQSVKLRELGRGEDALTAIRRSVAIFQELAAAQPDAFQADWALSLSTLSAQLGIMGRPEEALAAESEASTLWRELAESQPDRYLPELADSLNHQSNWLADLEREQEAVAAINEAITIYRELAAAWPDAFQRGLAMSLSNRAARLINLGQGEQALAAADEAIAILRELYAKRPSALRPDLADSLLSRAIALAQLGRYEDGGASAEEAIGHYRILANDYPARHARDLANALDNLAFHLTQLGREEEAQHTRNEANNWKLVR